MKAGTIFGDLVRDYLSGTGIELMSGLPAGKTLSMFFEYEPLDACFDLVAEAAGYLWTITEDNKLWVRRAQGPDFHLC